MEAPKLISLPDLVQSAADDLRRIHAEQPDDAVMQFTECEVELEVVASVDAKGKVKFWVVEAGGGASYENSQKVKLKFAALPGKVIQAPLVAGEDPPQPKRQG
jgi:hypothetical protein